MSNTHPLVLRIYDQDNNLKNLIPATANNDSIIELILKTANNEGLLTQDGVSKSLAENPTTLGKVKAKNNKENIDLVNMLQSITADKHRVVKSENCTTKNLLDKAIAKTMNLEESDLLIKLIDDGVIRAAEKVNGLWQPQPYVLNGILNYFGTHPNQRLGKQHWDKIPLKTAHLTDEEFTKSGVRYAPGAMVRLGAYIGPSTVVMNQAFINIGAYIAGSGVMIDGGSRVASCAQIGKNVKFGAGSGIEGVLEPAGRLPSIVEDNVKVGAMCEISGIIEEGSVIASGVIMASGKKIYDENTGKIVPPYKCVVGQTTFLLPQIPPYRLAVGGSILSEDGKYSTDAIILKKGDLRDRSTMKHFEKQGILYS